MSRACAGKYVPEINRSTRASFDRSRRNETRSAPSLLFLLREEKKKESPSIQEEKVGKRRRCILPSPPPPPPFSRPEYRNENPISRIDWFDSNESESLFDEGIEIVDIKKKK